MCFEIKRDYPIATDESANHLVHIKYNGKDLSIKVAGALAKDMLSAKMENNIQEACFSAVESKRSEICELLKKGDIDIFINVPEPTFEQAEKDKL
ncbi:MAG: hypothetical protein PHX13_11605 [Thiovulaceae bacterium]|nr:hypothetical protein [Sulfurimonadaceae bacterium]